MDADAATPRPAAVTPNDDVDRTVLKRQKTPQRRRAPMTHGCAPIEEHWAGLSARTSPHRKDRRQQAGLRGKRHVSQRVNASMDAVQMRSRDASSHRGLAQTGLAQLTERDDAMLPRSDFNH
jgi:hypothetical protein